MGPWALFRAVPESASVPISQDPMRNLVIQRESRFPSTSLGDGVSRGSTPYKHLKTISEVGWVASKRLQNPFNRDVLEYIYIYILYIYILYIYILYIYIYIVYIYIYIVYILYIYIYVCILYYIYKYICIFYYIYIYIYTHIIIYIYLWLLVYRLSCSFHSEKCWLIQWSQLTLRLFLWWWAAGVQHQPSKEGKPCALPGVRGGQSKAAICAFSDARRRKDPEISGHCGSSCHMALHVVAFFYSSVLLYNAYQYFIQCILIHYTIYIHTLYNAYQYFIQCILIH